MTARTISDFDMAAVACGHDPSTVVGASDARHDRRVWDLLDALIDETLTSSIEMLTGVRPGTVDAHIAHARAAIDQARR